MDNTFNPTAPKTRALSPPTTSTQPKRLKPTPTDTGECLDWLLTPGNTHYARSASAFTTYHPLPTPIKLSNTAPTDTDADADPLLVTGIGRVHLPVQRGPADDGVTILVLHDVLHVPDALCNGFSPAVFGGWLRSEGGVVVGCRAVGEEWFATPFAGGFRLVLRGARTGGSDVVEGGEYRFGVWLGEDERRGFLDGGGMVE